VQGFAFASATLHACATRTAQRLLAPAAAHVFEKSFQDTDARLQHRVPDGALQRYRDSGSVDPKPQNPGRKSAFSQKDLQRLKQDIESHPDATLEELSARSRVNVSIVSFHNAIKKLGFTRKKKRYTLSSNAAPM
jgi:hypothetical protein